MPHSYRKLVDLSAKDIIRFNKYIDKTETCWLWTSGRCATGYGNFWYKNHTWFAHRVAYLLHYGVNPDQSLVCHTCDNPSCCNPDHLFLGTHLDNNRDRSIKGHSYKGQSHHFAIMDKNGEKNGRAKLTAEQVLEIRTLREQGEKWLRLAKRFGVNRRTIKNIVARKLWKHI